MIRSFASLFVALFIFSVGAVSAQDEIEVCSPADVSARTDEAIDNYQTARALATDMNSALNELDKLQRRLDQIQNLCANVVSDDSEAIGDGSLQNPYTFGTLAEVTEGTSIQLTGLIRPADQIIRNENRFNDEAGEGQVYVIVEIAVQCDRNFSGRCETNYFDYEMESVVYENRLDVSLFAGGTGSGGLPFIIRADDTNLKLLYRENMFRDNFVAFEATPSLANGVQVTASTSLNVRSGPSTNFAVAGNLPADQTDIAFGRNTDGTWLQVSIGWVLTELVTTDGDVQQLPVTAQ